MTASLTFVAPGAATTGVIDVREQEKAAFDAFVRARLPELLRFGRALTGSPEAAADLVQDALVKALAWAPRLRDPDALEGWFLRTLANGCIRTLRRRRVIRAFARLVGSRGEPAADPSVEPDRARLLAQLDQLPAMQKAAIVLRYGHDLSLDEIAATLGISNETVKTHLKRAYARLRLRLGVTEGGNDE